MKSPGEPEPRRRTADLRLRAHVAGVLAGAGAPADVRDDIEEELLGHLRERTLAYREDGFSEDAAASRAMAEFGSAAYLGGAFRLTYHSRLWAATIGVLLATAAGADDRPGMVRWLRFMVGLGALFMAAGLLLTVLNATPLWALSGLVAYALGMIAHVLAYRALLLGQRWALWYALGVAVEFVAWGVWTVINPSTPGSFTIPLGAFLGAGVLLGANAAWPDLQAFVARSHPISRRLTVGLASTLIAPSLAALALVAVPDPTQARATDLSMAWSMKCDRGDVTLSDGSIPDVQRINLVATMTWRRADVLPYGLIGQLSHSGYGDSAGYQVIEVPSQGAEPGSGWVLVSNEDPIDVATGEKAGWFGDTSPSEALLPATISGFTIAIGERAIQAGHTIRASWLLTPASPTGAPWPEIQGAYAHLDRFLLIGTVGCGQTVTAREVPRSSVVVRP